EDNNRTERSKTDLHHAILCIQERGNSTVILKYLIDYYTDNAKEYNNYGWMLTVTKAIPLLYDNDLSEFVQYLFKKSCFGITEAYTPPLHIECYDKKRGDHAAVIHSLVVKPCLALKLNYTLWFFVKNPFTSVKRLYYWFQTLRDRKVYMVPLPDFTAYPNSKDLNSNSREDHNGNNKYFWMLVSLFRILLWPRKKVINNPKEMSPFHRVIYEEKGDEIYRTPTIMAVLDFKWAAAPNYIAAILYDDQLLILQKSAYNTFLAFTTLVLWLELDDSRLSYPTYKINDTSNSDLYSNLTIYQDIDKSSWLDNYYSNPYLSIVAVFFWTNGRWDQLDQWDSYVVYLMSILGMLNLIKQVKKVVHTVAYKHRAELVADYEALEKPFGSKRGNPQYIYYIPNPDMINTWLTETEKDEEQKARLMDSIESSTTKNDDTINNKIDKISFIDEEIFPLRAISNKKLQKNSKSDDKLLKNVIYNESNNGPLYKDPDHSANFDDQLSLQERFNKLENEFKTRFDNQEIKFNNIEQNLKTILETLNNLNNPNRVNV
ncbi:7193_t:CDS:2, partial [Diversispora eburnea]